MGHPKKHRRKYEKPKRPWDKARIEREKKVLRDFGLRRKQEIWRSESILRNFRRRARDLQARPDEQRVRALLEKLNKLNIPCSTLEDVLEIGLEDVLNRRLQTVIYKKGVANTLKQARQFVTHGHVRVGGRRVKWPGYMVTKEDQDRIDVSPPLEKAIIAGEQDG